jgi:CRISPR/Cas system CMR-associated protein Cmr5 small subunit
VQIAALSASSSQTASLLKEVLEKFQDNVPAYASLVERLTTMVGVNGKDRDIDQLIEKAIATKHASILEGLAQGLETRKSTNQVPVKDQQLLVKIFFDNPSIDMRRASLKILKVNNITDPALKKTSIERSAGIMRDSKQPTQKRAEAIQFLALGDPAPYAEELKKLIVPKEETPVQLAALNTLSEVKGNVVSEYAIQQWPVLTPEIRDEAVNTFLVDSHCLLMQWKKIRSNPAAYLLAQVYSSCKTVMRTCVIAQERCLQRMNVRG